MKQYNFKHRWAYSLLIGTIGILTFFGCVNDEMPSKYIPEQFLILDKHEMNIGIEPTFEVQANAPSIWKVSSEAKWIHIEEPLTSGNSTIICTADANRGEEVRSCYVIVETFFKNHPIIDSVKIVQEVNNLPILEITPKTDQIVSAGGDLLDLSIVYNYGVKAKIDYLEGGDGWITLSPTSLPEIGKAPETEKVSVSVDENTVELQRVAKLIFESTGEGGIPVAFTITQKAMRPFVPAVTAFSDNFETVSAQEPLYTGKGWFFEANPVDRNITFKSFTNGMKALLIHGAGTQATAYGIMFPFNVKDMKRKALSYRWAPGNTNVAGSEKFEVVASTNYVDDPFKASWVVVADVTNTENPTKIRPLSLREVDLSSLADKERVYIAFRYTGANSAYRFDDVKVGDVE